MNNDPETYFRIMFTSTEFRTRPSMMLGIAFWYKDHKLLKPIYESE